MMLKSEKGVSAVEFALIAPLLFVLTFGIVEFGLFLFDKAVITNASREGARAAIVYNTEGTTYTPLTEAEIQEVVVNYANGYLVNIGQSGDINLTAADITCEVSDVSNEAAYSWGPYPPDESGDYIRITATYTYNFLVFPNLSGLLGESFDGTIDLTGTTVMRME